MSLNIDQPNQRERFFKGKKRQEEIEQLELGLGRFEANAQSGQTRQACLPRQPLGERCFPLQRGAKLG